ncbi:MAG: 2-oxoglutarate dehydrogenase E1 component, partial [Bryocella sp.]
MSTKAPAAPKPTQPSPQADNGSSSREATFDIFRRWGFLQASLDPLAQYLPAEPFPTPAPDGPASEEARRYYCGTIGAEFMHIASPEKR